MNVQALLRGWPSLWRSADLFEAVHSDTVLSDEQAFEAVLRILVEGGRIEDTVRTLLARGQWALAENALQAADVPDGDPLTLEVYADRARWRADAEVRVAGLTARAGALSGAPVALPEDLSAGRTALMAALATAEEAIAAHETAELSELEAEIGAGPAWPLTRAIASMNAIHNRRLGDARMLVRDDAAFRDAPSLWPSRPGAEPVVSPGCFPARQPWPWLGRDPQECLSWFGERGRPPTGFGAKWRLGVDDEQGRDVLAALEQAAAGSADARAVLLATALSVATGGEVVTDGVLCTLDFADARLHTFPGLGGPLHVESHDRPQMRGGVILSNSDGRAIVTWSDLVGSLGAGTSRRVHLLRSICGQFGAGVVPSRIDATAWATTPVADYVAWRFDLARIVCAPGGSEMIAALAAQRLNIAMLLTHACLSADRTRELDITGIATAWSSERFREPASRELETALGGGPASMLARAAAALGYDVVTSADADALLDVAEVHGDPGTVLSELAASGVTPVMHRGSDVCLGPNLGRLIRHLLPLEV